MFKLLWVSLIFAAVAPFTSAQPWELGGKIALNFAEGQSQNRINELNDRLRQITVNLTVNEPWNITQRPLFITQTEKKTKDPKAKPKTTKKLQSIELLLNNNLLLTVNEADVIAQGALSLEALANEWTNTLNQFFRQPHTKRYLYLSQRMPQQLSYQGKTYALLTDIVPDRGLFRTTGVQLQGRVIFWEVVANDRTYLLDNKTKQEIEKTAQNPDRIFIFDPNLQFIAYSKLLNEGTK